MAQLSQALLNLSRRSRISRAVSISRSLMDCASTPFWAYSSITRCPSSRPSTVDCTFPCRRFWSAVVKSGASGVDLFFALSAFLITSLLLRERQQTGGISLRLFYIRRILRIWPLYLVVMAVAIVFAHTLRSQDLPWYYVDRLPALRRQLVECSFRSSGLRSALLCGRSRSRSSSTWCGRRSCRCWDGAA